MSPIINDIREKLNNSGTEAVRISSKHFFKEPITTYGVKSADLKKISNDFYKLLKDHNKQEIFHLCEELWQSGYFEETIIACLWSDNLNKGFESSDFQLFERWINQYVDNWATCDTFCNHTVGTFIEMFPIYLPSLKEWTSSGNKWVRRASAVSLILPARRGRYLSDIFEIAERLLTDGDDMVQKGYGWMLKEASRLHQQDIFDFVIKHKNSMPRTALRYAIEKMPPDLRTEAMRK
jgi:3-methyladenine DNA glycosylase AlkD